MLKHIIYTDGSCWNGAQTDQTRSSSSVSMILNEDLELIDYVICTMNHGTSNVAEAVAILCAMEHSIMKKVKVVDIYTDSKYCIKIFTKGVLDKNWLYSQRFAFLAKRIKVNLYHVDRDSGNKYNEVADELAGIVRKHMDKFLLEHVSLPIK